MIGSWARDIICEMLFDYPGAKGNCAKGSAMSGRVVGQAYYQIWKDLSIGGNYVEVDVFEVLQRASVIRIALHQDKLIGMHTHSLDCCHDVSEAGRTRC